ncbi:MAG: hypothetical protein VX757_11765 [Planctomycetota bacterium]|nr:hypothetical protein [Planctomycetota bacterium]MED5578180.1 hypothetical protein [Planctomycetota bacterium]
MPSWPKLLHKKRGERSSVSHVAGSMGEAILAAALVQMGAVLAVWLIADTIATLARSEPLAGIWFIVLAFLAATACIATGTWRLLKLMLQESTTAERRSAFVGQAMALQRKLRARQANRLPNIPEPKDFGTQQGRKLSYRLPNSGRDAYRVLYWGLASLLLSMVSSGVLAVTLNHWTWTLGTIALSIASIILLVLVGVSIWWFVKQLLAWFRCGPTGIELSQFPLIPGTKAEVLLSQAGRMRLRNLEFSLECVEIAVYQQGTDARREVTIVDEIPIHTEPRVDIAARRPWEKLCELEIPEDAMHSFIAASNAIQWRLAVRAKGVNCPSLSREAPIVVFPKPTSF